MNQANRRVSRRPAAFAASLGAALMLLLAVLPIASAAAAPSPWWQVITGSRPSNLWKPSDSVQEITTQSGEFGAALKVQAGGKAVACLGTGLGGLGFCPGNTGFAAIETAEQLETALEAAFGTAAVEVSGGPVGGAPFVVTVPGQPAPTLEIIPLFVPAAGTGAAKTLSTGGSGRLVVKLVNLGDAAVDATGTPLTIEDDMPEGVVATGVKAATADTNLDCSLDSETHVTCTFEETLTSYEAIELNVFVNLVGDPPVQGEPGEVRISGANGPTAGAAQPIEVSAQPTPFGIERFSAQAEEEGGEPASQAGGHPFQLTTTVQANTGKENGWGDSGVIDQPSLVRNLRFPLPAGLVGNAAAVPRCSFEDLYARSDVISGANGCPDATAIGAVSITALVPGTKYINSAFPVFNLPPAPGEPARFGFSVAENPVLVNTAVDPDDNYRILASATDTTEQVNFFSSTFVLWGAPSDPRHDSARGWGCVYVTARQAGFPCERPAGLGEDAFLRMPVACDGPLEYSAEVEPWNVAPRSFFDTASVSTPGVSACNQVPFDPRIAASPSSKLAENPTGLDFQLDMPNSGLLDKEAIAEGQAKKVEVILPEGMTINPSQADGLAVCSPDEYAKERFDSFPAEGCPDASKIGEVQVSTPLLEEEARGSLYVAKPYDNPGGSLIGLYLVAKIPERGVLIKQFGKVTPDPKTGQLVTTFDDLPQLPFTSFKLHFRPGGRAPLVTPPSCDGDPSLPGNQPFTIVSRFTPWSASDPDNLLPGEIVTRTSPFTIERGVDGGACPSGGVPPFHPDLLAGTINNAAGQYSPFNVRLSRKDGEQEFTNFSIKLPPGVIGKLAGIPFCSDAGIAAAKSRTGPNGGQEELDSPSCPAASQVGRTLVGAGVGSLLTYAPGKLYMAGPYNGSPLSVVAITAAKVGPFDLGTVVVREALKINPDTAEVFVDATGSDPIPHIIHGVPVHARDIRIYVDRPDFVLNPTSCERTSTASTVLGSGLDFGSAADDQPVTVTSPFQAADCAALGFKPKLSLRLRGGTRRGATPALEAVVKARKGDANIAGAQVTLPHSEFLEQSHIRTICTRVQFNAGKVPGEKCPAGSVYGHARAITPLLDEPIEGPVYLRSSPRPLPDLVAALHSGKIDVNVVGYIDSVKGGRIRNTFATVPDAPVSKFVLKMQGGKKGLLVNSTNICKGKNRAIADFTGHNGREHLFKPLVKGASCRK